MKLLRETIDAFTHLLFPHLCAGCGTDILSKESTLCIRCISELPETHFCLHPENPVEKRFWGRVPIESAAAMYYFNKDSLTQELIHQLKYRGNKELGIQLGKFLGYALIKSSYIKDIDALIPLPLFRKRERKRGYNQAAIICNGIADILQIPALTSVIIRNEHTQSQTGKSRIERWQNMKQKFELVNPDLIKNKHLLLVDDVITTGATLEACCHELLKAEGVRVSIAALCCA